MGLFLWFVPARAQLPAFEDTFESGTLETSDVPAGRWSDSMTAAASLTLAATPAAAHRGGFGFSATDADASSGSGLQCGVGLSGLGLTGTVSMRFWMRLRGLSGQGNGHPLQLGNGATPYHAVRLDQPGFVLGLDSRNRLNAFNVSAVSLNPALDRWYLVELLVLGQGTASASQFLYVDGVRVAERTGIDLAGIALNRFQLGLWYSDDRRLTGSFDYDDVRIAQSAQATSLDLESPVTAAATGDCVPFSLVLREAHSGGTVAAPYDVDVALELTGVTGTPYADDTCTTPTATLVLPAGSAGPVSGAFRATSGGTAGLSARHPDFLEDSLDVAVSATAAADGGTDPGPDPVPVGDGGEPSGGGGPPRDLPRLTLQVGCGCGTASGGSALLLALLLGLTAWAPRRGVRRPHATR